MYMYKIVLVKKSNNNRLYYLKRESKTIDKIYSKYKQRLLLVVEQILMKK